MFLEALTGAERASVHDAALTILEEVGMHLAPSSRAGARVREAGLRLDPDGRLRLPRALVEEALSRAPRVVRLGARDARWSAILDGTRTYVTTDGCGMKVIDLGTGERRPAAIADVASSARLTDALDAFHVYWMMVSAEDIPLASRVAREFLTALQNTRKHVQMIDVTRPEEARVLVRMARVLTKAGLAPDPPVSMLISVVSPLRLDPGGLEAALVFAAAGLPVAACSMPIASVTAPATGPGTLVLAHAEILGFAALMQIICPGAPVIYTAFPAFADARTGTTNYRDPRRFWAAAAATQMGHGAHLPTFTSGEMASLLMRPDMLCFGGLLEVSTLLSHAQLVADAEMLRDWFASAAPQGVTPETLAIEVIRGVGPGGHFLAQQHTRRHIREFVVPRFVETDRAVDPERPGAARETPREQARGEALRILASHQVPPLPSPVLAALERLLVEETVDLAPV